MTLVAAYWEYGTPVLLGDLLLSSTCASQRSHHIPTNGYTDRLYDSGHGYFNAGLNRKLYRHSGQLAMGWAGSQIAAKTVISDLSQTLNSDYIPRKNFFDFIATLDYVGGLELGIVGIFCDLEGTFTFRWTSVDPNKLSINGNYFEGTGSNYLSEKYSIAPSYDKRIIPKDSSPLTETLKKISLLLGDELVNGETLQAFFGGGFELVGYQDGSLKTVTDIAFVTWVVNFENNKISGIFHRKNIIQQTYRDEILWIAANVYRDKDQDNRYEGAWRTEIYAIPPFTYSKTKADFPILNLGDFNPRTICHYFNVNVLDLGIILCVTDIHFESKNEFMEFKSSKDGVEIIVENRLLVYLEQVINEKINLTI
jgi:hypothetical protein